METQQITFPTAFVADKEPRYVSPDTHLRISPLPPARRSLDNSRSAVVVVDTMWLATICRSKSSGGLPTRPESGLGTWTSSSSLACINTGEVYETQVAISIIDRASSNFVRSRNFHCLGSQVGAGRACTLSTRRVVRSVVEDGSGYPHPFFV